MSDVTRRSTYSLYLHCFLTLWRPAEKGDFQKNTETHVALHGNYSVPVRVTDLVDVSKGAASLLVCTRKKIFWLGDANFFVSDVISGGLLGHLGPLYLALGANC